MDVGIIIDKFDITALKNYWTDLHLFFGKSSIFSGEGFIAPKKCDFS